MSLRSHADAILTGVIKVCESNEAGKKEVQVVLAVSPKTAASATKASNMINKELGNRKSVEEYKAERKSASSTQTQQTKEQKSHDGEVDRSFSNKAKNVNF